MREIQKLSFINVSELYRVTIFFKTFIILTFINIEFYIGTK